MTRSDYPLAAVPLGVGFVGGGPVTQAIHLPTLARLTDLFTVAHVTDITGEIATSVAARVGARASTSIEEMLDDPRVDVVAVCSPHQFHARSGDRGLPGRQEGRAVREAVRDVG
jgi:predicted dehydrogenase